MLDEADPSRDCDRIRGLVDPDRLGQWMDAEGLPGSGEEVQATFVTGGASNELFEIQRGEHRWALRRPPRMVPEGRNETMLREYRILRALADSNVPHPAVRAVCAEPSVLGATFYLMDFVDGWSPISESHWPEPFDSDPGARRGLAFELVDAIARLSRVDWKARGLEGLGRPDGFHDRQVDRWYAHLRQFEFRKIPGLDDAGDWLRGHRPRNYQPGIMHGDYNRHNALFSREQPTRLLAVLDWEMATIGDPLMDLGYLIGGWDP
ncbi:MAG: phosphotransferase family protein, partial [Acidimicrobiales bacterium]